ncbi:hypothetical protein ACEWY4_017661 [Coilia grayii]|uniref:AIG1-type G domain-containing protein n=1 Tax=Coilia grayii TaxID=363190 RepID=A0ABD1JHG9_9TELE
MKYLKIDATVTALMLLLLFLWLLLLLLPTLFMLIPVLLLYCSGLIHLLSEVRIVMLGWVVCGKSVARNVILNKEELASPSKTERCERHTGLVDGRQVTVVDTPGWWKFFPAQYTPDWVKTELNKSVSLGSKSPHALLLVIPADVSFLEEQRKMTEDNMKMFGEQVWRHTMVLFNWGNSLGNTSIEEHIESEGEPLRWLVEKCGNRYHVFDSVSRGDGSQVQQLLEKIDELEASLDSYDLSQEAPKTEITQSYDNIEEIKPEMVELLDKEWNRRDKELEEKVRTVWQETFGSAMKGNRSMDWMDNFRENEVSPDTGVEEKLPVYVPQTKSSDFKHPLPSGSHQQHHNLPKSCQSNYEEKMRETFEREWGRFKVIINNRVRGILFPELYGSGRKMAQDEHEPYKQGSRELEEWARHEDIIMERVQGIISELCAQTDFSSEPNEQVCKQATEKVLMWRTTSGVTSGTTSGLGSEADYQVPSKKVCMGLKETELEDEDI